MKSILIFVFCLLLKNISGISQEVDISKYEPRTFDFIKYDGKIGKYPITMFLTFYPDDRISGYYFYNNVGKFIRIESKKIEYGIELVSKSFEQYSNGSSTDANVEIFNISDSIYLNKSKIIGDWIKKGSPKLQFILEMSPNNFDWRFIRFKSIGYHKKSYFHTKTSNISFVYPSIHSSPPLNKSLINTFVGKSNKLIDYINSNQSKSITIEENEGERLLESDDGCWSNDLHGEIVFFSDSILTYKINGFSYCNNGYGYENIFSIAVSSGKMFKINDIFKEDAIDTVLTVLKNRYKDVIEENSEENFPLSYGKKSNIFLSPNGVYFRERCFKLSPYIDLFLSFREIQLYINDSFKRILTAANI